MYKIIRFYRNGRKARLIKRVSTLEIAQLHCSDDRTHKKDKDGHVVWFDGYTKA